MSGQPQALEPYARPGYSSQMPATPVQYPTGSWPIYQGGARPIAYQHPQQYGQPVTFISQYASPYSGQHGGYYTYAAPSQYPYSMSPPSYHPGTGTVQVQPATMGGQPGAPPTYISYPHLQVAPH